MKSHHVIFLVFLLGLQGGCKSRQGRSAIRNGVAAETFEACNQRIQETIESEQISCAGLSAICREIYTPEAKKLMKDPESLNASDLEVELCKEAKRQSILAIKQAACRELPNKFTVGMDPCPLTAPEAKAAGWEQDASKPELYHPGAAVCYRKTSTAKPSMPFTDGFGRPVMLPSANQCCYGPASEEAHRSNLFTLITTGKGAGTPDLVSTVGTFYKIRHFIPHHISDVCPYELIGKDVREYHNFGWAPLNPSDAVENTGGFNPVTGELFDWFKHGESAAKDAQ